MESTPKKPSSKKGKGVKVTTNDALNPIVVGEATLDPKNAWLETLPAILKDMYKNLTPDQLEEVYQISLLQMPAPVTLNVPSQDSAKTVENLLAGIQNKVANGDVAVDSLSATGGTEMMKGTEADSHFMVIARKSGLKIGIRPMVFPMNHDGQGFLYLGFRLRVETESPDGNVLLAGTTFGIAFKEKATHASAVCGVKLISLPCSAGDAHEVFENNLITQSMVGSLVDKLNKAGATSAATPDQIVEYMNLLYETQLPSVPVVVPAEFPLLFSINVK